jgi:hypothetical protein
MIAYYRLDGHKPVPCELMEWAHAVNDADARIVAQDDLPGDVLVSTVFLGIDHSFGVGPPLLFETMIFKGPHGDYQERHSTWDEAVTGHEAALKLARGEAA